MFHRMSTPANAEPARVFAVIASYVCMAMGSISLQCKYKLKEALQVTSNFPAQEMGSD